MTPSDDFPRLAALFVAGMLLPLAIAVPTHDLLSLYLGGQAFALLAATAFALVAWAVLATTDPDRVEFALVSVVLPWIVAIGLFVLGVALGSGTGAFAYLFFGLEDLLLYAGLFAGAGLVALAAARGADTLSARYPRLPAPRRIAVGALVVAAVAVLGTGAVLQVTASSASITAVDTGVADYQNPVLNVTVESDQTELRLAVTGPDGTTVVERLSAGSFEAGATTAPISFYEFAGDARAGTYTIELRSISGLAVDSRTFEVGTAPAPALRSVRTAGPGDPLVLDLPADAPVYRPSPGATDDETRVGVVLENVGDVADGFDVRVRVPDGPVISRELFLEAGQQGGNVLAIPEEYVRQIRERGDGSVVLVVGQGQDEITEQVELPD